MNLIIHRGTEEIGGTCIEVISGATRILLDFGMPLSDDSGEAIDDRIFSTNSVAELIDKKWLYPIKGLYKDETPEIKAILISHSHKDHYGFLRFAHPDIPVFMSRGAKTLIEVLNVFLRPEYRFPMPKNIRTVSNREPFDINDEIRVVPYLMDHSAYDAMAYLIIEKKTGQSLFYTGDFRASGWQESLFNNLIADPPRNVDALLIEGTMLGREGGEYNDEKAVKDAVAEELRSTDKKIILACCSGQNIDRVKSFYDAAHETGSILVLDPYTACVLAAVREFGDWIPQMDWEGSRVLIAKYFKNKDKEKEIGDIYVSRIDESKEFRKLLKPLGRAKIKTWDFKELKSKALVLMRPTMIRVIRRIAGLKGATLIYSQWRGYLQKEEESGPFKRFIRNYGLQLKPIHTSGHATEDHLRQLAAAINPKVIIPVHTKHPGRFPELFPGEVRCLKDSEPWSLAPEGCHE